MARISASAARALDETRRAMTALTAPPDEALATALRRTASEVGDRYDVPVELTLDETVAVPPGAREQLVGIVVLEGGQDGLQVGLAERPHRPTGTVIVVEGEPSGGGAGHGGLLSAEN